MKPSELIRLAIADLEKCEADPKYRINMQNWMQWKEGVCHVCLGGAVLAQTLQIKDFDTDTITSEWRYRIQALDSFRTGRVCIGFHYLHVRGEWEHLDRIIEPYSSNPELFKKQLLQLANDLQKEGL